jgi:phage terminase small subunit
MPKTEKRRGATSRRIIPPKHPPKKVTRLKVFRFTGDDGIKHSLTLQQKLFCENFCSLSMNGIDALIAAGYAVENKKGGINYNLARTMARENLLKPSISAYVTKLLDKYGLNDDNLDKQLKGVVNQWGDLNAKVRAIDIAFKKRGSYAPEKVEHNVSEEVRKALDRLAKILPAAET